MNKKSNLLFALFFYSSLSIIAQSPNNGPDILSDGLTRQKVQNPIVIHPKTINQLFAPDAMQTPGIAQFGPQSQLNAKRFWLRKFTSDKKLKWNISVPKAGSYYVDFLINSKPGTQIKVAGPKNSFVFVPVEKGWQRTQSEDILQLPAGASSISLQLVDAKDTIDIKSIELINAEEKTNIEKRILAFKGDASWLKDAGYGIMTQVGGWAYPPKGDKKPWPGFAEDFDVKAFVNKVRDMGAKYIVWSATWSDYLFPAPIKAIAEVLPDRVSKRDLIGDLIKECHKYNIRVMLYYHLGHDHKDVLLAKGWKDSTEQDFASRRKWLGREMKIFTEIGKRYGKGLDAIFLDDGCVWYPADFEKLGATLKTGNPKRLICYNPWVGPNLTPFQDFYCGEGFNGKKTDYKIDNGIISKGPQKGLQLFGNSIFDGPNWGINSPNVVIRSPQNWTSDKIIEMTQRLEKEHYSVALNLLVYEDGTIGEESYKMLKAAAMKLKRGKWAHKVVANAHPSGLLISVKDHAGTYLYGSNASKTEGSVARQNGDFMRFSGPSKMEWTINVKTVGVYEVNLYHSVKSAMRRNYVSIASGKSVVSYKLMPTQGVWGAGSFESILLPGTLKLNRGNQLITLTIPETENWDTMDFRCLELIPEKAKLTIDLDNKDALHSRANSSWLAKAGYGLMFHWTSQSVSEDGTQKTFAKAVDDFDVNAFAGMVESTGAGYVIFTVSHAEPYCPAPLKSWEKFHPGYTTRRDLIDEIATALNARGIKLICYFPPFIIGRHRNLNEREFTKLSMDVITEFGERYGKKVAGYWFDGWYQGFEEYPDFPFKRFFQVCKIGNPDRIMALNSWIYPAVTVWEEYWAGETASPVLPPKEGTIERGPGKGLRYQALIIMEPYWVQQKAEMPDPRFNAEELSKYIAECMKQGGAVTINLGIYQDGTVDKRALQIMKEVRKLIRE